MPGPNTATYLDRLLTFLRRAVDVSYDNTESGLDATDVQAAIDEIAGAGAGPIATNRVLANVSGSDAVAEATDPQELVFASPTSGAGNIQTQVAPQAYVAVSSLATASNANYDVDPGVNGTFLFSVIVRVKMATAGTRLTVAAQICANRSSGTLTIEGSQLDVAIGNSTGLTLTLSATSGSLRANLANATGETVSGRVHVGWFVEDLL